MGAADRRLGLADPERGALARSTAASASAASRALPASTTRATTPHASASSAVRRRPVRMTSRARAGPTSQVSVCVLPPPGKMPTSTSGRPNDRRARRDDEVARERELEAAGERDALDRGDRRHRQLMEPA